MSPNAFLDRLFLLGYGPPFCPAGAHWGADAVGGAINFRTTVDYDKKLSLAGNGNDRTINGNYYTKLNDFDISVD